MVVDFEAAWVELGEFISSKPGHGAKDLHAEMAAIVARNRIHEDLIEKVMRLYGGSFRIQILETGTNAVSGLSADSKSLDPGASTPNERGTDERTRARRSTDLDGAGDGPDGIEDTAGDSAAGGTESGSGHRSRARSIGERSAPARV